MPRPSSRSRSLRWLALGPVLLLACSASDGPPPVKRKLPDSTVESTLDVALRCDDYGANRGWSEAVCETGGNKACQGQGLTTSDCDHCCEAAPPPTCAGLAQQKGWKSFTCESSEDWACGGLGEASSDCDVCCEGSSASGSQSPAGEPSPAPLATCAQVAAEWGYEQAVCETGGNEACGGEGIATSDCDVCCDVSTGEDPQLADEEPPADSSSYDEEMAESESHSPAPGEDPSSGEGAGGEEGGGGSDPGGEGGSGPPPTQSCATVAVSNGWDKPSCEYDKNGACNGQGPATTDCDHCCPGTGSVTPPSTACGDGVCAADESCSSCSADCGTCLRVAQVNLSGVDTKAKLHKVARQLKAQKPDLIGLQGATKAQAFYLDKHLAMTDTRFAWAGEQGGQKVGHALLSTYELDGFQVKPLPGQRLLLTAEVMAPQGMFTFATTQLGAGADVAASAALAHLTDEHALLTASLGESSSGKAYKTLHAKMPDGWSSGWGEGKTTEQREDFVFWGKAWPKPVGGQAVSGGDTALHRPVVQKNRKPRTKKKLKVQSHPRLLVRGEELANIKETLKLPRFDTWNTDNTAAAQQLVQTNSDGSYTIPLVKVAGDGDAEAGWVSVRRPNVCWPLRDRILALGMAYRLDPQPAYAVRAIREMLQVTKMEHWVADPFKATHGKTDKIRDNARRYELDTGEILMSMALGYDWFLDAISPGDRRTILRAILNKGIKPGLKAHRDRYWWLGRAPFYNWTHVCTSGAIIGSLAVLDASSDVSGESSDADLKKLVAEVEDSAGELLERSVRALKPAMRTFGPDGAWMEGPMYWSYAAFMATLGIESMRTSLKHDHDRPDRGLTSAAFRKSGNYLAHAIGPTHAKFNYADSSVGVDGFSSGPIFWISRWSKKPVYADVARNMLAAKQVDLLDVLWHNPKSAEDGLSSLSRDALFRNVNMVSLRSGWDDKAMWVAFKGGKNGENHGDLDLGTFVLEAGGQRFAVDHGASSYSLPDYFRTPKRFSYYTKRTAGQSTLSFTPSGEDPADLWQRKNQDDKAKAPIVDKDLGGPSPSATVDLSDAYPGLADKVRRRFELSRQGAPTVTITDKISGSKAGSWSWVMQLNPAAAVQVSADGKTVTLTLGSVVLEGRVAAGSGVFSLSGVQLTPQGRLPPQNNPVVETDPYTDVPYLAIHAKVGGGKDEEIKVTFRVVSGP